MKGKNVKRRIMAVLLLGLILLQGCSIKKAQTTIKVALSDDKQKVLVDLKADTSQDYVWYYFTETGLIGESTLPESTDDALSTTFITKYRFSAHDEGEDTMYFVLVKGGDLENAKAYIYEMTVNAEGRFKISDPEEKTIGLYPELLEKLQKTVDKASK